MQALGQLMACSQIGDKSLSEQMVIEFSEAHMHHKP